MNEESERDDRQMENEGNAGEPVLLPAEEIAPEEAQPPASEVQLLQEELGLLEGQLQDMRDRYLRAVADLDNMRKRTRREMKEAQQRAAAGVLLDVLSIVDNFERALGAVGDQGIVPLDPRAFHDGIAAIHRQLVDMLGKRGVKPIPALGRRFDPALHEAVARVPAGPGQEDGVVALEIQKGYFHGDQVLRPSKVGVFVHQARG